MVEGVASDTPVPRSRGKGGRMVRARRVVLFAGLLAGALIAGSAPATTSPARAALAAPSAPKVMVVGDSITQGSAGDYTWRYRLYKHLVGAGLRPDLVGPRRDLFNNVTNQQGDLNYVDPAFDTDHNAIWGRTIAQTEQVIENEARAAGPDYLVVLLGINDLTFFTDAAQTEVVLRRFLANARNGRPKLKIVLGTVLPTSKSVAEPAFAARLADYNARLAAVAAELSTARSPITVAATARDVDVAADLYDGVHPNARGELKIAAAFADALSSRFGLGAPYPRPLPVVPIGPRTPPRLTAEPLDQSARLSWTESPGATGYWVWRRVADSGAAFERLTWPLPFTENPWTHLYLANGVTYEFQLQPAKYFADGVFSNVVRVTPTPQRSYPERRTGVDGRIGL